LEAICARLIQIAQEKSCSDLAEKDKTK